MYIANMDLQIDNVTYAKNSELSDKILQGANVDFLKDNGVIKEKTTSSANAKCRKSTEKEMVNKR